MELALIFNLSGKIVLLYFHLPVTHVATWLIVFISIKEQKYKYS